jgi:hypothetical protein
VTLRAHWVAFTEPQLRSRRNSKASLHSEGEEADERGLEGDEGEKGEKQEEAEVSDRNGPSSRAEVSPRTDDETASVSSLFHGSRGMGAVGRAGGQGQMQAIEGRLRGLEERQRLLTQSVMEMDGLKARNHKLEKKHERLEKRVEAVDELAGDHTALLAAHAAAVVELKQVRLSPNHEPRPAYAVRVELL